MEDIYPNPEASKFVRHERYCTSLDVLIDNYKNC